MIQLKIASYTDNTGEYANSSVQVQKALNTVAADLSRFISGPNATIDVDIRVMSYDRPTASAGGSYLPITLGPTRATVQSVSEKEAITGVDANGAAADATITLSRSFMQLLAAWSADPSSFNGAVTDELLRHEVLHTLGWSGFRNKTTGALPDGYQSVFDTFITIENGKPYFTGENAVAIYGSKVPLIGFTGTASAIYHIDDTAVALGNAIMAPAIGSSATELDVELAVMKDLGFSISKVLVANNGRTFIPGTAADTVTGTAAIDRAIYAGRKADYTITSDGSSITVKNNATGTDIDKLFNVERIEFSDVAVAFDGNAQAGQAYRLYQAAFDRKPDLPGIGYWMDKLEKGVQLLDVAYGFINSPEFQSKYGPNLSNKDFVTLLYKNVLHREPDASGAVYWEKALQDGVSRAQILLGFSESVENRSQVIVGANGSEAQAYRLYQAAFDRAPDQPGLNFWINHMGNGLSLTGVAASFIGSNEFQTLYGANPSTTEFVTRLYSNVLNRAPDAAGQAHWEAALNGGTLTRAQVLMSFSESAENRANVELVGVVQSHFDYIPVA
ncbi:DUF4214 domain-containing protein [Noviherbaspirillum malthae]|uniref:DUF4214 domain-containing protein n=1 Tax=Noviherbaspirillum malthae TaxID=1260987 RepID=UPI00188DD6AA|nr:DUF4214 domain-containing protein [Noviherbaspirillum malthae]